MVTAESPAEAKADFSVVLWNARWRAGFLWFCDEDIGEAQGSSPVAIPLRRLFYTDLPKGRTGACANF